MSRSCSVSVLFVVVRRRDRDDVVEAVADRDVLRRAAFVLVAALLRPPAALVGMVPVLRFVVMLVPAV